jgi:hypothetical protein
LETSWKGGKVVDSDLSKLYDERQRIVACAGCRMYVVSHALF